MLNRLAHEQKGVTVVIVTIVLFVLIGITVIVVDAGMLLEQRRVLQNAVDAAALAGAQQLVIDQSQATAKAYEYAGLNGVSSGEVVENRVVSMYNPNDGVTVRAQRDVNLFFAPALGTSFSTVEAKATAILVRLESGPLWPWGVTQSSLEAGTVDLKVGARNSQNGNFMALDFPGSSGANDYNKWIKYGYQGDVPSGVTEEEPWLVDTEPGNVVGPTMEGVWWLQSQPYDGAFADIRNPTVGIVPILADDTWETLQGKTEVEVIGFAIFHIDEVYDTSEQGGGGPSGGPAGQAAVRGSFMTWAYGVGQTKAPGGSLEGLIGVRLIE